MSRPVALTPAAAAAIAELAAHPVDAIVFGGSAGALEGLMRILPALPAGFRAAVLVVVHLPSDRPSGLTDLFGPRCAVKVEEAIDKQALEPGTVLIAPPDCHLLVERGATVALSVDEPVHYSRPGIDPLFETAAWALGERVLGVVLSGASEDGADGLAAIARAGGLGWVQAPDTAQIALMPMAALARVPGARRLSTPDMAAALALSSGLRGSLQRTASREPDSGSSGGTPVGSHDGS
jgi:two-component system chemotaxis response regulator CheB